MKLKNQTARLFCPWENTYIQDVIETVTENKTTQDSTTITQ